MYVNGSCSCLLAVFSSTMNTCAFHLCFQQSIWNGRQQHEETEDGRRIVCHGANRGCSLFTKNIGTCRYACRCSQHCQGHTRRACHICRFRRPNVYRHTSRRRERRSITKGLILLRLRCLQICHYESVLQNAEPPKPFPPYYK